MFLCCIDGKSSSLDNYDKESRSEMHIEKNFHPIIHAAVSSIPCAIRNKCSVPESDQLSYTEKNCFCDDLCTLHGDCCQDYEPPENSKPMSEDIHLTRSVGSCQRIEAISNQMEISIITSCPRHFEDEAVKLRCEQKLITDVFYDTPVTGVATKLLYRNLFCAQCAGEIKVSFWNLRVGCGEVPLLSKSQPTSTSISDLHALIDHVMDKDNRDKYFCQIEYFHPSYAPRQCKSHLGKCHRDWTNRKIKKQCKTNTSYVYAGKQVFRNRFCAQCNFVNDSYTTCEDTRTPRFNSRELWDTSAPFTISIDPNQGSGTVKYTENNNQNRPSETHIVMERCAKFEVYDPFSKRCRRVMCLDPTMSPICAITTTPVPTTPKPTTITQTTTEITTTTPIKEQINGDDMFVDINNNLDRYPTPVQSDQNCYHKLLNDSDYYEFNNGTIFVRSTQEILTPIQYQRDGIYVFILICTPDALHGHLEDGFGNPLTPLLMFQFSDTQKMTSFVGLVISLVCLFVLFVLHLLLKTMRTTSGCSVMSLCVALFGSQSLFLLGLHTAQTAPTCFIMAFAMHYSLLASFFWMNVLAIDMLHTVTASIANSVNFTSNGISSNGTTLTSPESSRDKCSTCRFVGYSFYAWCMPAVIVGCSLSLEYVDLFPLYRPHYGREHLCWITSRNSLLYFFALPLALLLAINIILFICTLRHMFSKRPNIHRRQVTTQNSMGGIPYRPGVPITGTTAYKIRDRSRLTFFIQYCFIVGLMWIFAFVASLSDRYTYLWYAFTGLIVFQSFVLCMACLLNKKTLKALKGGGRVHRSPNTPTRYSCARESNGKHLFYHYDEDEEVIGAQETSI